MCFEKYLLHIFIAHIYIYYDLTHNGVKQGTIIFPIIRAIYMDDLYLKLKDGESGCHISNHYVGSYFRADVTQSIAPSVQNLLT